MGGQIEQWLRQSPEQKPTSMQEKPNSISSWLADDDTTKLRLSADLSDPLKAKNAARVLRLHSQTGIPLDVIERDPDEVERRATSRIEPDDLRRLSPSVAGWLAEHPLNLSAAGKEIPRLSAIERMTRALTTGARVGWAQSQEGMIGFEASKRGGQLEPWQRERLTELSRKIQESEEDSPVGPFLNILYQGAKIYGQMADAIPRAFTEGLAGASAGAAAAAVGGPTIVLAPWAAAGGFAVGLTHGFTEYAFRVEGGQAYLELSRLQDEEGNRLSEETKRNAAMGVGAVNALLETTGAGFIVAPFRSATRKLMRNAVSDALYRPTMAGALADFGKAYALAIAGETSTEILQELTNVVAEELAMNKDDMETPEGRESVITRLASIAQQTVAGMLLVGFPGAITTGSATAVAARRAQRREQLFLSLGETIAESETFVNLPEAVQQIVEKTVEKSPIKDLYFPVQQWNEYWQGKEVDPADIAQRVLGNREAWEEANQTGGDIKIPTSRYATEIAPTEHNAFFAKEMRTGPNELSAREAAELLDEQKKEAEAQADEKAEQTKQESEEIEKDTVQQLVETGMDRETAATNAVLHKALFQYVSERTGITAEEYRQRYNIKTRRLDEDAEAQTQEESGLLTKLSDEQVVELFMTWKGVLQDPDIAQHLKDIAWVKVQQLEGPARAIRERQTVEANERTRIKFGHEDFPRYQQGPRNPKVPTHAVKSLEDLLTKKRDELQAESATNLRQWRAFKYVEHIYNLAKHGAFDDVNVFMAQLEDSDVAAGAEALAMLEEAEDFTRWRDDMNMEPPDLFTLEQGAKKLKAAVRTPDNKVFSGAWHGEALNSAAKAGYSIMDTEDGFVTDKGDFFTREEAADVFGVEDTVDLDFAAAEPFRITASEAVDAWANTLEKDTVERAFVEDLADSLFNDPGYAIAAMSHMGVAAVNKVAAAVPAFKKWLDAVREGGKFELYQEALPFLPGFFSKAEALIEAKMPNRATVQDVRNILKDIKADERKWLGLDAWLQEQESAFGVMKRDYNDKIEKQAVLDFLRANRLEIVELKNTGEADEDVYDNQRDAWIDETLNDISRSIVNRIGSVMSLVQQDDKGFWFAIPFETYMTALHTERGWGNPTSEDIREWRDLDDLTAITNGGASLPDHRWGSEIEARNELRRRIKRELQEHDRLQDELYDAATEVEFDDTSVAYEDLTLPGGENYRIVAFQLPQIRPQFTDTHTGVSTKPNIFAHARLKDRTGPNGEKILFVEEIQSDWHQRGRESGYITPVSALPEGARVFLDEEKGEWAVQLMGEPPRYLRLFRGSAGREMAERQAIEFLQEINRGKVPDAPFRSTWHEFVFKRLIRMAAEGGYDQIAWTTGEQQNDRYNLEKHVDEIRAYIQNQDAVDRGEEEARVQLDAYKDGSRLFNETIPLSRLGDYVGKEVAVKLMSQPPRGGRVATEIAAEIAEEFGHRTADIVIRYGNRQITGFDLYGQITGQTGNEITSQLAKLIDEYKESYDNRPGTRTLKGEDLRVGGQGMRGFYDEILVRFANNFGKKYKTKSESAQVGTGYKEKDAGTISGTKYMELTSEPAFTEVHGLVLSPEIKQAALRNEFTLYQRAHDFSWSRSLQELEALENALTQRGLDLMSGELEMETDELTEKEHTDIQGQLALIGDVKTLVMMGEQRDAYNLLSAMPEEMQAAVLSMMPRTVEWIMKAVPLAQEARGRIQIGPTGINIDLLRGADPSTFIHETGHLYLEVLHDLRDKSTDIRQDYDTVRKWLGAEGDGPFTREQHEMFARGFEKYLAEGRSPVPSLRRVFMRFKVWLLSVYSSLDDLNVELSDEVRQVFGKILASESELKAIQSKAEPLFSDPSVLDEETARDYAEKVESAKDAAAEEIQKSVMREWRKESTRVFQAERAKTRREVGEQADVNPWFKARALLAHGTLPSGAALPEGEQAFKLSYEDLVVEYGKTKVDLLPKGVHARGGLHPDMAADLLGFKSGHELVNALLASEDPQEWIERRTTRIMRGKKTGLQLMPEAQVPTEALKAVHNEKRTLLLHRELEILAEQEFATFKKIAKDVASPAKPGDTKKVTDKRGRVRRIPTVEAIRTEAERAISAKRVRDLQPSLYLRAERKAATEAMELFLKGDIAGAFQSKQKELLNHELYRAAVAAEEESEKIAAYARKFDENKTRQRLGLAGGTYLEQIDGIRERFEFSELSGRGVDKKIALRQWIAEQNDMMLEPTISEKVQNEAFRQNYKELTVEELREVHDAMKSIAALARVKNRLLASSRKRGYLEAKSDIVAEIKDNHKLKEEPLDLNPTFGKNLKDGVRGFMAAHNKAEFIFEWLDGYKEMGTVWTYFFKPFVDAENTENRMQREAAEASRRIFSKYTAMERSRWSEKKTFQMGSKSATLTKANIMVMALNWGNVYNREALVAGYEKYGWTEAGILNALDTLDERDIQTVQEIWDWLDSYWPQAERLQREVNGLPPQKVEATPWHTKYGTFRGGYYPVIFDNRLSWKQAALDLKQQIKELFGGHYARMMTRHGHLEERVGSGGKAIKLSLSGLSEHVNNVIHDISHRRAVIDVSRLIDDTEIRMAIEQSIGTDMYKQLRPWLMHIAAPKFIDFTNPIEQIASRARTGATIVNLGWKITTVMVQWLGFTNSVNEIGPAYAARGVAKVYGRPDQLKKNWEFVTSRSEFMRHRLSNYDRDVGDAIKRMNIGESKIKALATPIRNSFFMAIGWADMAVSLPSWLGAYSKVMDGKVEGLGKGDEKAAIDYADKVIRQTQGVGNAKDLATIQRGPETVKLFTMFYTYFAGLYNQFAKATRRVRRDKDVGRFAAAAMLLWFIPAVMGEYLLGRAPDFEDDEEAFWKWLIGTILAYPAQSVILARDIVNGMRYRGYEPSAAFDMFSAFADAGKMATEQISDVFDEDDKEVTRYQVEQSVQAVGYAAQLPTRQLWLTMEYLFDWWTGEEEPETPAEGLFRAIVAGKPREE